MTASAFMQLTDPSALDFARQVRGAFGFLADAGFAEVEASPTLLRYQKGDVEIDIYHGRQSFEIGAGVSFSGTGTRYAMSEIIRAVDPELAKGYRNAVATSPEGIAVGLAELAALMQRYGRGALSGEQEFVSALEQQRKQWAEGYALEVLTAQLRPRAEDAFRRGDYEQAAELYGRIRDCLSPAEAKKFSIAQQRCSDRR
jgi:hypothetical protein